jgi:hypothetical protein
MTREASFDVLMARVAAGERLEAAALAQLETAPDLLALGMLADAVRRRAHGADVTFLRVALVAADVDAAPAPVPAAAGEVRLDGAPATFDAAAAAVAAASEAAAGRAVAAFAWEDVQRYASDGGRAPVAVLRDFRAAGLAAIARVALDMPGGARAALEALAEAGFEQLRVSVERVPSLAALADLAAFQEATACVRALSPLPGQLDTGRPTTGYRDVRAVALARLAAPNVPTVQVDWTLYGPKLAQVALTFGADDLDGVSPVEAGADGRRRAPLAEVRRNIEAAGLRPVERDGRFTVEA